ncbi:signal peptidase [Thioclava dalianensis]|uniref:Signal peptidase n=1 Tax=Thioclava dalianensis TaxID=1185766 RepID=A0A074TFU9_9RHOB|nr:imelysin family protein [Thioclava dalianensis]KEP70601.1 signal peptidase [Thioclava dalianensis]SFN06832.1 hypothetical protein SAMN05216224_102239 [Thioclava dalianensis]
MRFLPFFLSLTLAGLAALPLRADVPEAVNKVILPDLAAFTQATEGLARTASQGCDAQALKAPWNAAFDAWLKVQHFRMGPFEEGGRGLAIAFWPDPKATGARQMRALLAAQDPQFVTPEGAARLSIAARGLYGLSTLIWQAPQGDYACKLRAALADNLVRMAQAMEDGWRGGFAEQLLDPGADGHTLYLTQDEARQALFTQLIAGLEFNADQRLGRPLGSFDHPRPNRAEAIAEGRSLRNVTLSLRALKTLSDALAQGLGATPQTDAAFAHALQLAGDLDDPVFAGVETPASRLRIEILQQAVRDIRAKATGEIGALLGVSTGFNSADGD